MEFKELKQLIQKRVNRLTKSSTVLYKTDVNKDLLWDTYLNSYAPENNQVFRERQEHDCSCCRSFIKQFANVVALDKDNNILTIWDVNVDGSIYEPVVKALDTLVKSKSIRDVFLTKEKAFGTDKNKDGEANIIWHHFQVDTPKFCIHTGYKTLDSVLGDLRTNATVLGRALKEITDDAVNTVLDLIKENNLHRGTESKSLIQNFKLLKDLYNKSENKENFVWNASTTNGVPLCRIRNSSIGTLLVDLSENVDLVTAVKKYEDKVSGTNYKRSKPLFTKQMLAKAKEKIEELGYRDSLHRRYAKVSDVTSNNLLYVDRTIKNQLADGDPFAEMEKLVATKSVSNKATQEINIEDFIKDVLPTAKSLELFIENKHQSNLVSLIAPNNKDTKSMFKWNNNFSWAYTGNVADSSMKENVKSAGGSVTGDLRFSIQWNENRNCKDDLDAHCRFGKHHIYYPEKGRPVRTGILDVDIVNPGQNVAVENITFPDRNKMDKVEYEFSVKCYSKNGGTSGFSAEIEFDGEIHEFHYALPLKSKQVIQVASVVWDGSKFTIKPKLDSSHSQKEIWNVKTNSFVPITAVMHSPNYWDDQKVGGNKQYMFMLANCISDEEPNGFYNEFLCQELYEHKKVMEALGATMKVENVENQLSGLGFSSTKRNEVVIRVEADSKRNYKVKF